MPDTLTVETLAIRLQPQQVTVYWPLLRKAIIKAIGRIEETTIANIYDSLMEGILDLWLLSSREENPKPVGVVLGGVTVDLLVGYRNYLIYGAYALTHVEDDAWKAIFTTIETWARSRHCSRLVAFTDSPRVVSIAELVGAMTPVTMLEKEL